MLMVYLLIATACVFVDYLDHMNGWGLVHDFDTELMAYIDIAAAIVVCGIGSVIVVRMQDRVYLRERIKVDSARVLAEQAQTEATKANNLLNAMNQSAAILLNADNELFHVSLHQSMRVIGEIAKVDRVYIWKNHVVDGELYCTQVYEWSEGVEPQQDNEYTIDVSYSEVMQGMEAFFSDGGVLNGIVREMTPEQQAHLSAQGILSILMAPVFLHDQFWGVRRVRRLSSRAVVFRGRSGDFALLRPVICARLSSQWHDQEHTGDIRTVGNCARAGECRL